jgi:hypothetical protein
LPEKVTISSNQRKVVYARANGHCEYCQSPADFSTEPFTIDHIYPKTLGGPTTLDNLALACTGCNLHKATQTHAVDPQTGNLTDLFHPCRQRWSKHFCWREEATTLIGLTPTGRATIAALHLNRPALLNLRRVLQLAGEHPPYEH